DRSTTTAVDGSYSFGDLRPGTYVLTETQPDEYLDGKDTVGTQGGTAGDDVLSNIVLLAGVDGTDNNFGALAPSSLAVFVYVDDNRNGVFDPASESGIFGVTITLTGVDDLGNAVSVTTTTDIDGSYSFVGLRPGTYSLHETQPARYRDGA